MSFKPLFQRLFVENSELFSKKLNKLLGYQIPSKISDDQFDKFFEYLSANLLEKTSVTVLSHLAKSDKLGIRSLSLLLLGIYLQSSYSTPPELSMSIIELAIGAKKSHTIESNELDFYLVLFNTLSLITSEKTDPNRVLFCFFLNFNPILILFSRIYNNGPQFRMTLGQKLILESFSKCLNNVLEKGDCDLLKSQLKTKDNQPMIVEILKSSLIILKLHCQPLWGFKKLLLDLLYHVIPIDGLGPQQLLSITRDVATRLSAPDLSFLSNLIYSSFGKSEDYTKQVKYYNLVFKPENNSLLCGIVRLHLNKDPQSDTCHTMIANLLGQGDISEKLRIELISSIFPRSSKSKRFDTILLQLDGYFSNICNSKIETSGSIKELNNLLGTLILYNFPEVLLQIKMFFDMILMKLLRYGIYKFGFISLFFSRIYNIKCDSYFDYNSYFQYIILSNNYTDITDFFNRFEIQLFQGNPHDKDSNLISCLIVISNFKVPVKNANIIEKVVGMLDEEFQQLPETLKPHSRDSRRLVELFKLSLRSYQNFDSALKKQFFSSFLLKQLSLMLKYKTIICFNPIKIEMIETAANYAFQDQSLKLFDMVYDAIKDHLQNIIASSSEKMETFKLIYDIVCKSSRHFEFSELATEKFLKPVNNSHVERLTFAVFLFQFVFKGHQFTDIPQRIIGNLNQLSCSLKKIGDYPEFNKFIFLDQFLNSDFDQLVDLCKKTPSQYKAIRALIDIPNLSNYSNSFLFLKTLKSIAVSLSDYILQERILKISFQIGQLNQLVVSENEVLDSQKWVRSRSLQKAFSIKIGTNLISGGSPFSKLILTEIIMNCVGFKPKWIITCLSRVSKYFLNQVSIHLTDYLFQSLFFSDHYNISFSDFFIDNTSPYAIFKSYPSFVTSKFLYTCKLKQIDNNMIKKIDFNYHVFNLQHFHFPSLREIVLINKRAISDPLKVFLKRHQSQLEKVTIRVDKGRELNISLDDIYHYNENSLKSIHFSSIPIELLFNISRSSIYKPLFENDKIKITSDTYCYEYRRLGPIKYIQSIDLLFKSEAFSTIPPPIHYFPDLESLCVQFPTTMNSPNQYDIYYNNPFKNLKIFNCSLHEFEKTLETLIILQTPAVSLSEIHVVLKNSDDCHTLQRSFTQLLKHFSSLKCLKLDVSNISSIPFFELNGLSSCYNFQLDPYDKNILIFTFSNKCLLL